LIKPYKMSVGYICHLDGMVDTPAQQPYSFGTPPTQTPIQQRTLSSSKPKLPPMPPPGPSVLVPRPPTPHTASKQYCQSPQKGGAVGSGSKEMTFHNLNISSSGSYWSSQLGSYYTTISPQKTYVNDGSKAPGTLSRKSNVY